MGKINFNNILSLKFQSIISTCNQYFFKYRENCILLFILNICNPLAKFQVLNSHIWLIATIVDSAGVDKLCLNC